MFNLFIVIFGTIINFFLISATIKNRNEIRKMRKSTEIYTKMENLVLAYKRSFYNREDFPILNERVDIFQSLLDEYDSYPYRKVHIKEKRIFSSLDEIEALLDERDRVIKEKLPDLYTEIGCINRDVFKTYSPVRFYISEIKYKIFARCLKIIVPLLKLLIDASSKQRPKDIVKYQGSEIMSANVKLKLKI